MHAYLLQFFTVFLMGLMSAGLHAQTQYPHASYWKKYSGMPPLDIRVSLNGKPVIGLFEQAQAESRGKPPIPLDSITIPLVTGQRVDFKVEVAKRDTNRWVDVTQHQNLYVDNDDGGVRIDKKSKQLIVLGAKNPQTDFGYASITIYYTDRNPADEQAGFTVLYLDIRAKP